MLITVARRGAAVSSCVLICLASSAVGSAAGAAGSTVPAPPGPSNSTSYSPLSTKFSLTISPTRLVIDRESAPKPQLITVVNRGGAPLAVTVEKRNFVGALDGTLQFQEKAPFSASNWLTARPAQFTVAPGQSQIVTATITMPVGAEPGDHQVALVFLVPAGQTSANIRINRGVATPVYITVPGRSTNTTSLSFLHAAGFSAGGPVTLTAQVHDTGNTHRDFRGKVPLAISASGKAVQFPDFTVLRGSKRVVTVGWHPPLMCICHVRVTVLNARGVASTRTIRVIVFPVLGGSLLVGALVLIIGVAILMRRRYHGNVTRAAAALNSRTGRGDA